MEERKTFPLQWDKLAAAVAYLAERSRNDDYFGVTKLVKLLYYADCAAYLRTGRPITGATYVHMPHGPYPDDWQRIERWLEDEQAIVILDEDIPNGHRRRRPVAGGTAAADALDEGERRFLDEQLRRFADFSATQIEDYSHDELAWHVAKQGEVVPYELSGIRRPSGPPDEETTARGRRIAKRIREEGRRVTRVLVKRDETV